MIGYKRSRELPMDRDLQMYEVSEEKDVPLEKKTEVIGNPCERMTCPFWSQCHVDEQSTPRAYCRCAETCPDVFAPVCGDDGVTYSSECRLRLASCTQQERIEIDRQGSCAVKDPCKKLDCRFGSSCETSLDGHTARCACPEKCFPAKNGQALVCGSDGKNYASECELRKTSCKQMRAIEVKFQGVCDPCDGVDCPTAQVCQLDENRNPICRCNSVCSPDFRPVCGSDGRTYTNECTLRVGACKSRKNIRIFYTGECSSGANPCDSLQCGPFQECDIDRHGRAACHCGDPCERVVRPVCGSDGETYLNECEMRRQGCLLRKSIKLAYRGECGERGLCYNYRCRYGALCVLKSGARRCECPSCTEEYDPVCGTDGISYTNHCKLTREGCEQKSEIAVAYTGLCTGCENKRCEYYAVCESDGRGTGMCVCPKTCIKVESLVCGTDEETYLNECEMRVEACKKAQYVLVASRGPCDLCRHVHCKYGARCEEGKCVCPTECPGSPETVCANDGVTYRNECEMRHAACLHDQELTMLYYGECDEAGESHDEGSGAESDCEDRTCRYGGVCEYSEEGLPVCACPFKCPSTLDPVCGSDGRLHDNECRLKEEACRRQKTVMSVHIEMCEEVREVPCSGERPLADPATQRDYYCGEGVGSKLCPPGSYCHKTSAFAKCCREVILIKTCFDSQYGCCPDGKTSAQGPGNAGCPSTCNCNRLGSYGLTCAPADRQCFCKPGVGGPRCDRCEPGYWGLHRITDENSGGCSPCACNLFGSVRDDCEQMTGRCVCKPDVQGMKCDRCPEGAVLGPDGCTDASIARAVSGSCDDLVCSYGAECAEAEEGEGLVRCACDFRCSPDDRAGVVCGSDGGTYGSECQMKLFSCRYQKPIEVRARTACPPDMKISKSIFPKSMKRRSSVFHHHGRKQHTKTKRSKGFLGKISDRRNTSGSSLPAPEGNIKIEETNNPFIKAPKHFFVDINFRSNFGRGFIFHCERSQKSFNTSLLLTVRENCIEFICRKGAYQWKSRIQSSKLHLFLGRRLYVPIKNFQIVAVKYKGTVSLRLKIKTGETPFSSTSKYFLRSLSREQLIDNGTEGIPLPNGPDGCINRFKMRENHFPSRMKTGKGTNDSYLRNGLNLSSETLHVKNFWSTAKATQMDPLDIKNPRDAVPVCTWMIQTLSDERRFEILQKGKRFLLVHSYDGNVLSVQQSRPVATDEPVRIKLLIFQETPQLFVNEFLCYASVFNSRTSVHRNGGKDLSRSAEIRFQRCAIEVFINKSYLQFTLPPKKLVRASPKNKVQFSKDWKRHPKDAMIFPTDNKKATMDSKLFTKDSDISQKGERKSSSDQLMFKKNRKRFRRRGTS